MRREFAAWSTIEKLRSNLLPMLMIVCGTALLPNAWAAEPPPGKGRETFNKVCTACHDADVAMQQRNTRAGWAKIVQFMKDMGAEGTPEQFNEIIDYLSEHFGAQQGATVPVRKSASAEESEKPVVRRVLPWEKNPLRVGQALYRENCVVCHDIDGEPGAKIGPSFHGVFRKDKMPMSNARPSRSYVIAKIRTGGRIMPSFAGKLSTGEVSALLDYMQSK